MRWTCLLAFLGVFTVAPAGALTIGLPAPPTAALEDGRRFARIDSLEAIYRDSTGARRAHVAFELGELYAGTGRSKHLVTAQEYFAEAIRLEPTWREAVYASAVEYSRSGYDAMARERVGELLQREPGEVDHVLLLARLENVAARRQSHAQEMDSAYQLYVTALGLAPDRPEALAGASATALLVENLELARSCALRWRGIEPGRADPWLVGAAAEFRRGNLSEAWTGFLRGVLLGGEELRAVFLGESLLLTETALARLARATIEPARARRALGLPADARVEWVAVAADPGIRSELVETWWMRRDESPDAFQNESQLEYWTRLVEAELRFGRPESGVRGWDTLPGEVWVRVGHPRRTSFFLSEQRNDASVQQASGLNTLVQDEYFSTGPLAFREPLRVWNWEYVVDGVPLRIEFVDFTYGEPDWGVGLYSPTDLGTLRERIAFVEPSRTRAPADFELGVAVSRFPRGGESILETAISARAMGLADTLFADADSVVVEWQLTDAEGLLLDEAVRSLRGDHRLSRLITASGQSSWLVRGDPWLTLVGARVPEGRYRIRVRAINPATGRFSAQTLAVNVPGATPPEELAMSSIQLSHGLPEWDPDGEFPVVFVKHGRALLHAPRAVIEGNVLGVFYEIENLSRDRTGQTRFDVEYAIYRGTGDVRLAAMLGAFDPAGVEEVEPATVQYLQERTGVSPEGLVVKGTEIDVSGLVEGDYVLRVRIDDRIGGRDCTGVVAFRRPPRPRDG